MSTENIPSVPVESPAADVEAPAEKQESMDIQSSATGDSTAPVMQTPPPQQTDSSDNVTKTDSEKNILRPAQPQPAAVIKPPVPKTIQMGRQSKQSIEQMEEAKLKAKFGGLQKPGGSQFLQKRLNKGIKYFDSGDYNMAKQSGKLKMRPLSGKQGISPNQHPKPTGEAIPTPDSIHNRKPASEISKLAV